MNCLVSHVQIPLKTKHLLKLPWILSVLPLAEERASCLMMDKMDRGSVDKDVESLCEESAATGKVDLTP